MTGNSDALSTGMSSQYTVGGVDKRLKIGPIKYRDPNHVYLPHVINFSGGRSSAALAFMFLDEGLVKPERGDLLLFANTSAEHPGTYEFVAECKERIESEYGVPFLWVEFCTVEDAWRGEYRRKDSYRLVKPVPVEDDPDGYRSKGEVFEELLNFQGMLPNPHTRSCTAKLKLFPSHKLLADWFGGVSGPLHAGHYWPSGNGRHGANLVCAESFADKYIHRGGSAPREQALARAEHLASLPSFRPSQRFCDYTDAEICYFPHEGAGDPRPAVMRGHGSAEHVRLLGLRADEPKRVDRVLLRCLYAEGAVTSSCTVATQPPGERPYFPLFDSGIDAGGISQYWDGQSFGLDIPEGAGNCTYCFMKGTKKLAQLANTDDARREKGTPVDINWWADVERRHIRVVPKRDGEGMSTFGFFGVNSGTFEDLANGKAGGFGRYENGTPACDCTD